MYKLVVTQRFKKNLMSIDHTQRIFLLKRIKTDLNAIENPREFGKPLKGYHQNLWRYRFGNYRVIVEIQDEKLLLLALAVGHRQNIYNILKKF